MGVKETKKKIFFDLTLRSQVLGFGGGQGASVASRYGDPGACPRKIFGDHALEMLGKRGKRLFQLIVAS